MHPKAQHVADLLAAHGRGFYLGPDFKTPDVLHAHAVHSPTGHRIGKLCVTARTATLTGGVKLAITPDTTPDEIGAWCRREADAAPAPPHRGLDRLKHRGLLPDTVPTPPEGVVIGGVRVRVFQRGDTWAYYVTHDATRPKWPKTRREGYPEAAPDEGVPREVPKHIKALDAIDPVGSEGVWTVGKYGTIRWAAAPPEWRGLPVNPATVCADPFVWAPLCPLLRAALTEDVVSLGKAGAAVRARAVNITINGPDWSTDAGGSGTCDDTGIRGKFSAPLLALLIRQVKAVEVGAAGKLIAVRGPKGTAWLAPKEKA